MKGCLYLPGIHERADCRLQQKYTRLDRLRNDITAVCSEFPFYVLIVSWKIPHIFRISPKLTLIFIKNNSPILIPNFENYSCLFKS